MGHVSVSQVKNLLQNCTLIWIQSEKLGSKKMSFKARSPGMTFSRDHVFFFFYLIPDILKWHPIFMNFNSILHVIFMFWKEMTGCDLRDTGKRKRFFNRIWIYLTRICCSLLNYVDWCFELSSLITFLNIYWLMIIMATKTEEKKKSGPSTLS